MPLPASRWSIDTVNAVSQPATPGATIGPISSSSSRVGVARHAHEAARPAEHEVDRLRGHPLRGERQVAFVLAVFVVDDEHHLAAPDPSQRVVDAGQRHLNVLCRWVGSREYGVALDRSRLGAGDRPDPGASRPCGTVRVDRFDAHVAAVQVDDPAGDREAEAGAAVIGGAGGVGAVETLEDPRRVGVGDAGALVGHFDADRSIRRRTRARRRRRRLGEWRTAFSTRFATTWCRRSASASSDEVSGSTVTDERTSPACNRDSRTASSSIGATSKTRRSSGTPPDSSRERSSSCCTSRPSRSTWASIVRSVSGSGGSTPSTRFSSTACSAVIGVRSSWLTLATRSRRRRSVSASSAAIWLNDRASVPISSREVAVTRWLKSPRAIASLAATISRNGEVMPRARNHTTTSASAPATIPQTDGHMPMRTPAQNTTTVTATAARMTTDSFSLSVGSGSSGRSGGRLDALHDRLVADGVPDAVHGADDVGAELAAQRADVRVDGARARRHVVAPHLLEQLFAGRHPTGPRREVHEQVELGRREVHELAVLTHAARRGIELDVADRRRDRRRSPATRAGATQDRVHARDELAGAERLRHVVVGADLEPDDEVGLAVARGEHEHRHRAISLDALAHLDPVEAGEHEVEHDEVGLEPRVRLEAARPVARDLDRVALAAEPRRDRAGDRALVLDDEDAGCRDWAGRRLDRGHRKEDKDLIGTEGVRPVEKLCRWRSALSVVAAAGAAVVAATTGTAVVVPAVSAGTADLRVAVPTGTAVIGVATMVVDRVRRRPDRVRCVVVTVIVDRARGRRRAVIVDRVAASCVDAVVVDRRRCRDVDAVIVDRRRRRDRARAADGREVADVDAVVARRGCRGSRPWRPNRQRGSARRRR